MTPRICAMALLVGTLVVTGCGGDPPTAPAASTSVSQLTVTPDSVAGGESAQGQVTLAAPAPGSGFAVSLSSGASAAVVPASTTVAAGATSGTFTITTQPVASDTNVTLNASANGETRSAMLVVRAPALAAVDRLQVDASFEGGQSTIGTVYLDKPAPSATVVTLSSQNTSLVTVPSSVTIAAGASSTTFTITSRPVMAETVVTISASAGGQTRTADIHLRLATIETMFSYSSAAGDYIGQGRSQTFRQGASRFQAYTCSSNRVVNAYVTVADNDRWVVQFMSPSGALMPGTYVHDRGFPTPGQAYLTIGSPGRMCNTTYGRFTVTQAIYGDGGAIRRFRATFEQRCGDATAPLLTGEISLNDPPTGGPTFC